MFEGALDWVMSLILILYLTANGIGLGPSGAFGVWVGRPNAGAAIGLSLRHERNGLRQCGRHPRQIARSTGPAAVVANATGMSQQEASQELSQISGRVEAARNDPAQASAQARQGLADLMARGKAEPVGTEGGGGEARGNHHRVADLCGIGAVTARRDRRCSRRTPHCRATGHSHREGIQFPKTGTARQ